MYAIKSNSKDDFLILCVTGWMMSPVFCGDVAAVGTLDGVRTGK